MDTNKTKDDIYFQLKIKYEWQFFYNKDICDPGHSQNLMGSKLDKDPSAEVPVSSIGINLLANKQTN